MAHFLFSSVCLHRPQMALKQFLTGTMIFFLSFLNKISFTCMPLHDFLFLVISFEQTIFNRNAQNTWAREDRSVWFPKKEVHYNYSSMQIGWLNMVTPLYFCTSAFERHTNLMLHSSAPIIIVFRVVQRFCTVPWKPYNWSSIAFISEPVLLSSLEMVQIGSGNQWIIG